jgi:hypothetical protein
MLDVDPGRLERMITTGGSNISFGEDTLADARRLKDV